MCHHTQPLGNFKHTMFYQSVATVHWSLEYVPLASVEMCALLGLSPSYTDPHLGGRVLHIISSNDTARSFSLIRGSCFMRHQTAV